MRDCLRRSAFSFQSWILESFQPIIKHEMINFLCQRFEEIRGKIEDTSLKRISITFGSKVEVGGIPIK